MEPINTTSEDKQKESDKRQKLTRKALHAMEEAYLMLQVIVQRDLRRNTCSTAVMTDSVRASLRNMITELTGETGEQLQNRIEASARDTADLNNW